MGFFSEVRPDEGSGKPRVLPSRTEPIFEFFMTAKFGAGNSARPQPARPAAAQPEEPDEPEAAAEPAAADTAEEEGADGTD